MMKKQWLTAILCAISILSACKKKDDGGNPCGSYSGVVPPNTYIFWIDHDFSCGSITVEVKDASGKIVGPYQAVISYTSPTPPQCNNVNYGRFATFDLYMGKTYTYKATCSGKTWTGTITVPCEQSQCKNIQLQ
ncbi:hypothetical protein A3860_33825 [Niastella vici]|uniref:Uncharacterized protein n=1 Tax=Niastella vici TaxID=1703345 RepID=A0A1V9FQ13_9BACT|nr:hypothetical protein [Niastella vici]OQP60361.1 hypothetical protein A3860_33825 [Niastella vici]